MTSPGKLGTNRYRCVRWSSWWHFVLYTKDCTRISLPNHRFWEGKLQLVGLRSGPAYVQENKITKKCLQANHIWTEDSPKSREFTTPSLICRVLQAHASHRALHVILKLFLAGEISGATSAPAVEGGTVAKEHIFCRWLRSVHKVEKYTVNHALCKNCKRIIK